MTSTQKNEVRLIIKALRNILEDVVPGERVDLKGIREEEVILIGDLLAKSISSQVKIVTQVKDDSEE